MSGKARKPKSKSDKLPLSLLAAVKTYLDTLVSLNFFNGQGVAMFSFVRPPPRVPRPFAGARVYRKSLMHAERLGVVGCGLKGKLVRMLSLHVGRTSTQTTTATSTVSTATTPFTGTSTTTTISVTATTHHHNEPESNWGACYKLMQSILRYVTARQAAAVRDKVANEAEELCASGQFAAAIFPLKLAIEFGDMPSRALNAWLLIDGREGVVCDENSAFVLVAEGARAGCHHCQGVLARCYLRGGVWKDEARSLELARESARNRSRYGQEMLGHFYLLGLVGLAVDYAQAFAFHQLAAQQNLDAAQNSLGYMYWRGLGVVQDRAEALRWFQLAAAQGHPAALSWIADFHEYGWGVRKNKAEAIRWYRRAQAAGHHEATAELQRLLAQNLS